MIPTARRAMPEAHPPRRGGAINRVRRRHVRNRRWGITIRRAMPEAHAPRRGGAINRVRRRRVRNRPTYTIAFPAGGVSTIDERGPWIGYDGA